jgi:hypothetical protein
LFHSTLDDLNSVTNPAVGIGGTVTTNPANDFVAAQSGNGINLDAPSELVNVPQANGNGMNIDPGQGTIDFCYKPYADHDAGGERALFETTDDGNGWMRARISGSNADSINVLVMDSNQQFDEIQIDGADYSMNADEWYRITISWDFDTVGPNDPNFHIFLDGVELTVKTYNSFGPKPTAAANANGSLEIGAFIRTNNPDWVADGVIDEFKVYDSPLAP